MSALLHLSPADLTTDRIRAICRLIALAFPNPEHTEESRIASYAAMRDVPGLEVFAIFDGDRALAHAMVFPREIRTPAGALCVAALAAVCTDPERRGHGLGRAVVAACFARVDAGAFAVSLFQTGVPEFYARLRARIVDNPFINSRWQPPGPGEPTEHGTRDVPWWNPHVMIYPSGFAWPQGEIDLLGPGY